MKGLAVLGSTGSIGIQTLDICRRHPDKYRVDSLAAGFNAELLTQQILEFSPKIVSCGSEQIARELRSRIGDFPVDIVTDPCETVQPSDIDIVVGGLPGSKGLLPVFAAAEMGKTIALATKEVLVMAGTLFMKLVKDRNVDLLPVDSEQSAIFQCIQGNSGNVIRRILLTASGGPFREMPLKDMTNVTPEQALNHPRWKMGPKVTVDSATLMNKGLEVIEACHLFNEPVNKIEVVIHPESIVHSMVEYEDGSIMAQLGQTDMRIPISYALAYPDRIVSGPEPLDITKLGSLHFAKPDFRKFPLLKAAFEVSEDLHGSAPIVYNAADEVAVELFLSKQISFSSIPKIVLNALELLTLGKPHTLDEVVALHNESTEFVQANWKQLAGGNSR